MPKSKRCRCAAGNPSPASVPASASCTDVCASPVCGDPPALALMAPVIYDQLGINLCSTVPLTGLADFPTAVSASVQVIHVAFGEGTEIEQLTGRSSCYEITLANLNVTFAVRLYDCCGRLLTTLTESAVYLPPETADNYDEETNPDSVEFDLFAPYGVAYIDGSTETPLLNYVGFSSVNSALPQGLNVTAYAKLLNLDMDDGTATVGLTVYVMSVYYAQYRFSGVSRADIPKVSPMPEEDTLCRNFVDGSLLDLAIRPLELGAPGYEENRKTSCASSCANGTGGCCGTSAPIENGSPALPLADDTPAAPVN